MKRRESRVGLGHAVPFSILFISIKSSIHSHTVSNFRSICKDEEESTTLQAITLLLHRGEKGDNSEIITLLNFRINITLRGCVGSPEASPLLLHFHDASKSRLVFLDKVVSSRKEQSFTDSINRYNFKMPIHILGLISHIRGVLKVLGLKGLK
jgi:hypothetical protein